MSLTKKCIEERPYMGINVEYVIAQTKKMRDAVEKATTKIPKSPKITKKAQELIEIIKGNFGKHTHYIVKLVECITGEKIAEHIKEFTDDEVLRKYDTVEGAAIVLLDNPNEHSYELYEIILVEEDGSSECMDKDGDIGDCAPIGVADIPDAWRFATEDEIKKVIGGKKPRKKEK